MSRTISSNIDLVDIPQIETIVSNAESYLPKAPRAAPQLFSDDLPDYIDGDEVYVIEPIAFDTEPE